MSLFDFLIEQAILLVDLVVNLQEQRVSHPTSKTKHKKKDIVKCRAHLHRLDLMRECDVLLTHALHVHIDEPLAQADAII